MIVHPFNHPQTVPSDAKIVYAAVSYEGNVYCAWRHSTIIKHLIGLGCQYVSGDMQGFVDQYNNFYNRYQSMRIAYKRRQIAQRPRGDSVLISEMVWDDKGNPIQFDRQEV